MLKQKNGGEHAARRQSLWAPKTHLSVPECYAAPGQCVKALTATWYAVLADSHEPGRLTARHLPRRQAAQDLDPRQRGPPGVTFSAALTPSPAGWPDATLAAGGQVGQVGVTADNVGPGRYTYMADGWVKSK